MHVTAWPGRPLIGCLRCPPDDVSSIAGCLRPVARSITGNFANADFHFTLLLHFTSYHFTLLFSFVFFFFVFCF